MWNFQVVRCDNQRLGTVILRQEWRSNSRHKIAKLFFEKPHYSWEASSESAFLSMAMIDPLGLRLSQVTAARERVIDLGEPIIVALSSIKPLHVTEADR